MKKILLLLIFVITGQLLKAQCTFTLSPPGTQSITCTNTFVFVQAGPGNLTYTWSHPANPPVNGATQIFTATGVYTVAASSGTCVTSQTFAIGTNTAPPTTSVSPVSQAITCASNSPVTFSGTVTNPTVNIQHDWFSPLAPLPNGPPIATSNNTLTILSGNVPPGVYTLQTTNQANGCKTIRTVTVTSLDAYPTFSVSSTTNFSVGCSPLNTTTLSINGAISTQSPPSVCSFTFLPPNFAGTLAPGPYAGNTSTATSIPGTWTIIVNDNSNSCRTELSVPVLQNTVGPHVIAATVSGTATGNQTLTCRHPTILATGSSTTNFTTISWLVPSTPPALSTPTVLIGIPANGPNTSSTSLTYANYTVNAINQSNACQSQSVISIFQNFKPPVSQPTISIATATAIYCTASVNPVVLTTGSSTTTSGGGPLAFVSNPCWNGPSPQTPTCGASSYSCYVSGIYSLTVEDNYNGCLHTGTINVIDRTQPPVFSNSFTTAILDCGSNQATMTFPLSQTVTGGVKYYVLPGYPSGAAFSPTNAITTNINPILNGTNSGTITADQLGLYVVRVTNTLTGCKADATVNVVGGDLTADFDANPGSGYAPLTVNFFNNSSTTIGTASIASIWSFGNGQTYSVNSTAGTSTSYTSAGSYSVLLIAQKGNCIDTVVKVVKVDLPSKLEVPNVFTPNGDGSNDVFFLKVTGLSEITAVIFDRWGNKVYDVVSKSGNISWDGKNLEGKECASGVYYYVIKATGKDKTEYEKKGNVSIYR